MLKRTRQDGYCEDIVRLVSDKGGRSVLKYIYKRITTYILDDEISGIFSIVFL